MGMILSRQQFADHWNSIGKGLGDVDSVLWQAERTIEGGLFVAQGFIQVPSIGPRIGDWFLIKDQYWNWCKRTLRGRVCCFSSNYDLVEWWGFEDPDDIPIWCLRWL